MRGNRRTLATQQEPSKERVCMSDLSAFPDHQTLACQTSRSAAALFPADAERRQGLDHAGRDRPALRGASRRLQQGRPEDAGIPVAQSQRQDPRDPRSRMARAASRCRCSNPARSCNISPRRPASSCRPIAARRYETIQWVHFQMGGDRADVRPGRLLPQIRRQGV